VFFFLLIISEYKKPAEKHVEKQPHFQVAFYIFNRIHSISL